MIWLYGIVKRFESRYQFQNKRKGEIPQQLGLNGKMDLNYFSQGKLFAYFMR